VASTSKVFSMSHINQLTWVPAANIPSPLKWFLGLFSDFAASLWAVGRYELACCRYITMGQHMSPLKSVLSCGGSEPPSSRWFLVHMSQTP